MRIHAPPLCSDHRFNAKYRSEIEDMVEASGETLGVMPYDGCAEFHARDREDFETFVRTSSASDHFAGCGKRLADMT